MDKIEIAKNKLSNFIKAMNSWEKACNRIEEEDIDETEQFRLQKQMLTEIFSEYCTERKRQNGRPNTISYGEEGSFEYDPKEERIITASESENKVLITTKRERPMQEEFIYTLLRKGGNWLLDSKKRYSKWKKSGRSYHCKLPLFRSFSSKLHLAKSTIFLEWQSATTRADGDGRIGRMRNYLALRTRHVRACRQAGCQR